MRWISVAISVVFLLIGACLRVGLAQQSEEQTTARGMFGDRSLGHPIQPGASHFGSGIQRGPSGDLLSVGRTNGAAMFPTPWRRTEPAPLPVYWGPSYLFAVPGVQPGLVPQEQPGQVPSEQPRPPEQPTPEQPAPGIWFRSPPSETTTPPTSGSTGFYGPGNSLGLSVAGAPGSVAAAATDSFRPSPGVSTRITRLAQAGGVLTSSGVQVSVQGNTATIRGAVATSYDRSLVGSLVSLEPGVWHVDNQVTVVPEPGLAATTGQSR
jgi:hypothetical protein